MSDLCKCGHDARHHAFGKCNAHACCGNEKCDTTFLTNPDAPPADRDDLAAILAKHESKAHLTAARNPIPTGRKVVCACGEWWLGHALADDAHRAHVASMVLESDWLRGVRAKELRDAADEATCDQDPPCGMEYCAEANEITAQWLRGRADRVDAEDGGR